MSTSFYGKWSLLVIETAAASLKRVRIQGSLNADGDLAAATGVHISEIDGAAWEVSLEHSSDGGTSVFWHQYPSTASPP